ncbi:Hypothetical Protein FCC1311_028942 [Hondaea fermentalgiana]|uniref:Uncharacterized protein n=1 Tax=Hondaea fermentalgiana TaxID=2315210 RepID=A0A2R5GDG3_9STRA|nr:Hypothetical Protein FCC1311_028942 [Hondaea fermentalgiana]|eukprot:GBG26673.1 Hypothetical Protein FCC1311_028942 [Hondaea fermentalgiana]
MNRRPLTRKERHASKDKESKEKALLEQTRAPLRTYITEQDRFITDFAAEEKRRREATTRMKEQQLTTRRAKAVSAEEERWRKINQERAEQAAREAARKSRAVPRNGNSVPYNPLTLQYEESDAGEMLKFTDEKIRYRAALRAERLRHHEAKEGFNPITGEATRGVQLPRQPQPPSSTDRPF